MLLWRLSLHFRGSQEDIDRDQIDWLAFRAVENYRRTFVNNWVKHSCKDHGCSRRVLLMDVQKNIASVCAYPGCDELPQRGNQHQPSLRYCSTYHDGCEELVSCMFLVWSLIGLAIVCMGCNCT